AATDSIAEAAADTDQDKNGDFEKTSPVQGDSFLFCVDSIMKGMEIKTKDWSVFVSSIFFVLGFSIVFSLVGVLLQSVLANVSYDVQQWLGRIGGVIIILFGLVVLDLISIPFLERGHTIQVKKRFNSSYLTSFIFGAAFAVGWTPCVSAALGAILALAATQAASAFFLLVAYTMGLGIPFLLVGLFTSQAQAFINRMGKWLTYIQYVFGVFLVAMGIFIFTGELSRIANFEFLTRILTSLNAGTSAGGDIASLTIINVAIAFFAGLGSFLSPCILPIVPGFLSYLASTAIKQK
ncbi:MAG: cytochrome c biogenesis protein CcdA, partial [Candidatus Sungbacteria bacterium]|nr:cytochrome c biogenesis protein CcdA [Candidatus Sungbacteria bacterium]